MIHLYVTIINNELNFPRATGLGGGAKLRLRTNNFADFLYINQNVSKNE